MKPYGFPKMDSHCKVCSKRGRQKPGRKMVEKRRARAEGKKRAKEERDDVS